MTTACMHIYNCPCHSRVKHNKLQYFNIILGSRNSNLHDFTGFLIIILLGRARDSMSKAISCNTGTLNL